MSVKIPRNATPCYSDDAAERVELAALFDSTDLFDHNAARELCSGCPFRLECLELAKDVALSGAWAGAPFGTWGGELWRGGKPVRRRKAATA